jgi:acyl-coenzyme A synthetase/AMP-(fatty) acid ligase
MRLGNTVDFPIAYLGALAAGLVPVPTSPMLTAPEVATILADLAPAAVLHDGEVATAPHPGTLEGGALRAMRDLPPAEYAMGPPDRPGYIVYTSGTSGRARAVSHAHRAIWARQMMMRGWYGLHADDRLLHAGAFNWTFTLGTGLMDPWTMGATALIPAPGTPPEDLAPLLAGAGATIFAAAPGVYRKLLQGPVPALPALRHGLCAGEKLSPHLAEHWQAVTGTPVFEAYGMSECSTFISASPDHPASDGALGRPQPGRRIAILGPDGPTDLGTPGTIAVHRSDPGLMLGYLGAEEETRLKFQGDWFLTGDLGRMDEDGQVHYLGRNDDMMNAGGYRVSPLEVEAALGAMPGIGQVAVTDIEVKEDVRIIAAFYTAPAPLPEPDLRAFASQRLARYKQPRAFVHVTALPTGANGKLSRAALKPLYPKDTA